MSSISEDTQAVEVTKMDSVSSLPDPVDTFQVSSLAPSKTDLWGMIQEKIGHVEEDRFAFPDYNSGEVTRMFSSLKYEGERATHATGSVLAAAALISGTTVGAGVLALPQATAEAGFLPSTMAMLTSYVYMTMSGLLIAELTLNRMGQTGKPGLGLLELYENSLGKNVARIGSAAYFFLHYAVMVAYMAQGGQNLSALLPAGLPEGTGSVAFATIVGIALYGAAPRAIESFNNVAVAGVVATFAGIVAIGANTANFGALIDPVNQHPEHVLDCFPILFLAFVFQNVVPSIVKDLEGDRTKITKAIIGGTTVPLLMFLAWNAVVLGNVMGTGVDLASVNPVALLQDNGTVLGPLVAAFSTLAILTSIIGFTHGLVDAWTDVFRIPNHDSTSPEMQKWKPALYGLVFVPPLLLSTANPDIFFQALEYGGAFGVSTLFLVLPPFMVWNERYGDHKPPLITKPMVPLGKLPLGSMWKAAGTLILEQGAEKLGVFDAIQSYFS